MQTRTKIMIAFISLLICCAIFSGCQKEETPKDVKTAFLTAYFTSDYEERYSTWSKLSDEKKYTEKAMSKYHNCFEDLVTEEMYSKMVSMRNRSIVTYDSYAIDALVEITPVEIHLDLYSEANPVTYTYTVTCAISGRSEPGIVSGQLVVADEGRVSHIHVSSNTGFPPY